MITNKENAIRKAKEIRALYEDSYLRIDKMLKIIYKFYNITHEFNDDPNKHVIYDNGKYTIYLPTWSSAAANNYYICHGLGHIFLRHVGEQNPILINPHDRLDDLEIAANAFCAEFILPEEHFREMAKKYKNDDRCLGAYFGVTASAATVRLYLLNII